MNIQKRERDGSPGPKKVSKPLRHSLKNTNKKTVDKSMSNVLLPLPVPLTGNTFASG